MRAIVFAISLLIGSSAAAQSVVNTSYVSPSGERVLQQQAIVTASLAAVWQALTTTEGLRSFLAPVVQIDFRAGGIWETSYDPAAKIGDPGNIRNEILAYVPMKMIVVRVVNAPPAFVHPEVAKAVWTVIDLEDLAFDRVRVTSTMAGWKKGPEWDQVYDFFSRGNAQVLSALQKRFAPTVGAPSPAAAPTPTPRPRNR